MSTPKRIWHVLLADSPAGSHNDSKRFVRTCVFEGGSNVSLTASALCRKVVEASGEWLVRICTRHPAARDNGAKACILLNYGCGYATLVLMNGAELESSDQWKLNPISVNVVVASVKSEKSGKTSDARIREYGTVSAGDAIYDHLVEFQNECKEGVRIYLHPTLEGGPALEGAFDTDYATNQGDRKHVFRVWSDPGDPLSMSRIERTLALEKQLSEGSIHLRPSKRARTNTDKGNSSKKLHSQKTTAPLASPAAGRASAAAAAAAKGTKKAATTSKASAASAKSSSDKNTTKKTKAKTSTVTSPVLAPAAPEENPGVGEMAKKPGPKPKTAQKVKQGFQNVAGVASKVIFPDTKGDTAMKDVVNNESKKEAPEPKGDGDGDGDDDSKESSNPETEDKGDDQSKKNQLGFHPREIVLLYKAFEDTLDEDDLKKKVSYKLSGHDAYSEKDTKIAMRILRSVDQEVKEMRNHDNHPALDESNSQEAAKVAAKKSPAKPKPKTSKGATTDAKDEADKKKEAAKTIKKMAAAKTQDKRASSKSPSKPPAASKTTASMKKPATSATTEPEKKDDKPPKNPKPGAPKGFLSDAKTLLKTLQDETSSDEASKISASQKRPATNATSTEPDNKDAAPPQKRKPDRPKGSKNKVPKESKKTSKSSKKKSSKRKRESKSEDDK